MRQWTESPDYRITGSPFMKVHHYRDLNVYQLAVELQQRIFELTRNFPVEERYSLTDQVRRSSRAVGANIAEAWRKRSYPAHFVSKLSDSDAENSETEHWIFTAFLCGYLDQSVRVELDQKSEAIGRMIGSMIREADHWCA